MCQAGEAGFNLPTGTEGIDSESRIFGSVDIEKCINRQHSTRQQIVSRVSSEVKQSGSQEPRGTAGGTSPNAQKSEGLSCPPSLPLPPSSLSFGVISPHTLRDSQSTSRSARYHRPAFFLGCFLAHAGDYWTGGPWSARYSCCDAEARLCSMGPTLGWVGCDGSSRDAYSLKVLLLRLSCVQEILNRGF
jgi:hypothetical protein